MLSEIAAETDISIPTLSRIEFGSSFSIRTFVKLCRWLKLDPASVLELDPGESFVRNYNAEATGETDD